MKINDIQEQIIEEMSRLDDWIAKYEYLIGLGKDLTPLTEDLRTEENALPGCQSNVWLIPEMAGDAMSYLADSDSLITRGILALLLRVLNHQPPREIVECDLYMLDRIGLSTNLSPSRANGLVAMVRQMKASAAATAPSAEEDR
jgi:cysteine desulfuration protein SufE